VRAAGLLSAYFLEGSSLKMTLYCTEKLPGELNPRGN